MNEKEELDNLNKQIKVLSDAQSPLCNRRNEINDKKDLLKREKMVGKCFVYKNSGGTYKKIWNVYHKIIGTGEYYLRSINVELPENDAIISVLQQTSMSFFEQYCEEITQEVFSKQLRKAIEKIKENNKS